MFYSTRQFVLCFSLCYFVLVLLFFCHFSFAITSHREKRANLGAFRTFVRFALVRFCLSPHTLGTCIWEGLRFVIVSFPGLFCYLLFFFGSKYHFSIYPIISLWELCCHGNQSKQPILIKKKKIQFFNPSDQGYCRWNLVQIGLVASEDMSFESSDAKQQVTYDRQRRKTAYPISPPPPPHTHTPTLPLHGAFGSGELNKKQKKRKKKTNKKT